MTIIERIRARHKAETSGKDIGVSFSLMDEYRMTASKNNGPDMGRAVVNSAAVDLSNEVVLPSGADWTYARAYKSMYYNHDYDTLPVGIMFNGPELRKNPDRWAIQWNWASNPFAQEVKVAVNEGAVNGTSVGFIPVEKGRPTDTEIKAYGECDTIIRKWRCIEVSITPQPCNPDAHISGKMVVDLSEDAIHGLEKLVGRGRISMKSARLMGLPEPKPMLRKVILLPGA